MTLVFTGPPSTMASDIHLKGFKIVEEIGAASWQIQASEAVVRNKTMVALSDIRAMMLNGDIKKVWARGEKGLYNTDTRILDLEGDARAGTASGYRFSGPGLRWDGNRSNITSRGGVELTSSWLRVQGRTLSYNVATGITFITGDVRARWLLDGRTP